MEINRLTFNGCAAIALASILAGALATVAAPLAAATLQRAHPDCVIDCQQDADPLALPGLDDFTPAPPADTPPPSFSTGSGTTTFLPETEGQTTTTSRPMLPFLDDDDIDDRDGDTPGSLFGDAPLRLIPANSP